MDIVVGDSDPEVRTIARRHQADPDAPHVVICGAGFAGLSAISRLTRAGLRVTLVDGHLYSTFQPLLYQVATAGLNPGDVAYPAGGFARAVRGELPAWRAGHDRPGVPPDQAHQRPRARLRLPHHRHRRVGRLPRHQGRGRAHLRPVHPHRRHRAARSPHGGLRAAERGQRRSAYHRGRRRGHRRGAGRHARRAERHRARRHLPGRRSGPGPRPADRDGARAARRRSTRSCASTPGCSWTSAAWTSG